MTASTGNRRSRLTRRTFLLTGSAATATALSTRLGLAARRAFSAGYVVDSEGDPALAGDAVLGLAPRTVVPAGGIAPDTSLALGSVRLQARGLYGGPGQAAERVLLDVLYPGARPQETYPFLAWTYTAGCVGQRVSFVVPVSEGGLPELRITTGTAGDSDVLENILSLNTKRDGPRLRRGTYLLGLNSGQWSTPTVIDPRAPDPAHLSLVVSIS